MAAHAPLLIPALPGPVDRRWLVPGSKSITNRALVLAALAEGTSVLENVLHSDDTTRMRSALQALGIGIADGAPGQLIVQGGRSRLRATSQVIDIGNSGTSVRFLTALCALVPGVTTITGNADMAKRPIADLVEGMRQMGIRVDCASGCPPLTVHGGSLPGGLVRMRGDRSSQYFSALLLVAAFAERELAIEVTGVLVSRPYIEMTARMIRDFGGQVESTADGFVSRAARSYRARSYWIEPDASSASYPMALAAAGGHRLLIPRLDASSLQGDYQLVAVLEQMGAVVEREAAFTAVRGQGRLRGIDVSFRDISDTVMTIAAIAPLCSSPVTMREIGNIRIKETDRLSATVAELTRLGCRVESGEDWLRVHPSRVGTASIECYHDHRMAMAFGTLGAITGGITITDPGCTDKTYPGFWDDLATLYPSPPW
jgi:3-phosphoshikimate 1-carboxyvinyltransferase